MRVSMFKIKYDIEFRGMYAHQDVVLVDSAQPNLMLALILMRKLDNSSVQFQSDCISSYLKTFPRICNHEISIKNASVVAVDLTENEVLLLNKFGANVIHETTLLEWLQTKLNNVLTVSTFQGELMSKETIKNALLDLMDFNKSIPQDIKEVLTAQLL